MDRLPTEIKCLVVEQVATERDDDGDLHALALVNRKFRDLSEAARWEVRYHCQLRSHCTADPLLQDFSFKTQSTAGIRFFRDDFLEKYGRRIGTLFLNAELLGNEALGRQKERAKLCRQVLAGVPNLTALTIWAPSTTPCLPTLNNPAFTTLFSTSFGPSLIDPTLFGACNAPLDSPDVVALLAHFLNLTALGCMNIAASLQPRANTFFLTGVQSLAKLDELRLIRVGDFSGAFLSGPSWSQHHLRTLQLAGFDGIVGTIHLMRFVALFEDTLERLAIELHDDPSNLPSHLSDPFPLRRPHFTSFLSSFLSLQLLSAWIEIDKSPISHLHIARGQEWHMPAAVLAHEERAHWARVPPLVDLLSP